MSYNGADLIFPHLGIVIQNMYNHITLPGGFTIAYYGIIIGIGMLLALLVIEHDAARHGRDTGLYYDFFLIAITLGVVGARIYYVIFQWEYYRGDILKIINIREGGLAIYGGILAGVISAVVFCRVRKVRFFEISDCMMLGVLTGQILGRWGNFFNCEAFGGYTDSLFAMRIKESIVNPSMISDALREHIILDNGIRYIQVHPTFLYESCWNLLTLIVLYIYAGKQKVGSGKVTIGYFLSYGIGRFLIEGLRTDQLKIPGTMIPVSQALSACIVLLMMGLIIYRRMKESKKPAI